jgi:hypothetical protein
MKTIKILWKRLQGKTPVILKRIQRILLVISAITGSLAGSLLVFERTTHLATTCGIIAAGATAFSLGITAGLQASTTDKNIQMLSDTETGLPN